MAISTPQLYLVTTCEHPKDVWDTLHFERETLAIFPKGNEGGQVHLKEMKEVTDKLASIGAPISEEDQEVTLLGTKLLHSRDSTGSVCRRFVA